MLKLLAFTDKIWNTPSLKDVAIIGAQHIMESSFHLFCNLKKQGLDPSKTFLMGKCYSSSESVFLDFIEEGFQVSELSFVFDSHESYDSTYKRNITKFLVEALSQIDFNQVKKLVVLDDGGYLIDEINKILNFKIPIVSIEQTSAGIHYLTDIELNIPVINVARSRGKLEQETPYIIESSLNRFFEHVSKAELVNRNILVLGYGTIGSAVAKTLAGYQVEVYDPLFHSSSLLDESLKRADIILGCSGTISLKYDQYQLLKEGAILASFSSSDREFEAHHFRKLFPQTDNCKNTLEDHKIKLLQSGFPINFWGARNNMSLEKIQITLALLQSAIYQALNMETYQQGITCIDEESERLIMLEFQNIVVENISFRSELVSLKS